jgi:hypothetical protein
MNVTNLGPEVAELLHGCPAIAACFEQWEALRADAASALKEERALRAAIRETPAEALRGELGILERIAKAEETKRRLHSALAALLARLVTVLISALRSGEGEKYLLIVQGLKGCLPRHLRRRLRNKCPIVRTIIPD